MRLDPVAILFVLGAYVVTWLVTRLPGIPTFQGHETIAWLYLGHATIVAGALARGTRLGLRRALAVT